MFFRFLFSLIAFAPIVSASEDLPDKIVSIMQQAKYEHGTWGLYVKDTQSGKVLYDLNSNQMFLPASTTKLFSVAALLIAYGDNYRFKTPIYALGSIQEGVLHGNLVLVAQGDLTLGGRQEGDKIAFTSIDHTYANTIPGASLTKQNPLAGLIDLAKQVKDSGIKEIDGDVLIDDRLFQSEEKRGIILSPIMVNENIIDILINPTEIGKNADLSWRPKVPGYKVSNEVKTGSDTEALQIEISADELGRNIVVRGTIPLEKKDVLRTYSIQNPDHFARAAFIQALREQGIVINLTASKLPSQNSFQGLKPIAVLTSPPLSEYGKLILKVSHNLGAELVPMLLAVQKGQKTYAEGMEIFGKFVMDEVKLPVDTFVFLDAAGGDGNRVTPQAEIMLLEYMRARPRSFFQSFYNGLPILGVDGSLADFGKGTNAVGKVRAKTGTGVIFNMAANRFFLTTQTLGGYIEGQNGNLIEFMIAINNGIMPTIEDVFPIFEDVSQIAAILYENVK